MLCMLLFTQSYCARIPWSSMSSWKLLSCSSAPLVLQNPKVHYHVHTSPHTHTLYWVRLIQFTLSPPISFTIHSNMVHSFIPGSHKWFLHLRFWNKIYLLFSFSSYPATFFHFFLINNRYFMAPHNLIHIYLKFIWLKFLWLKLCDKWSDDFKST